MKKNIQETNAQIKDYINTILKEKLVDFQLVVGGQQRTVKDLIENKVSEILFNDKNNLITEKKGHGVKNQ